MEVTIEKHLGGSVWMAHGAFPLPGDAVEEAQVLVKFNEDQQYAELHVDELRPTFIKGKQVLKYTKARAENKSTVEVGQKLTFEKFFIVTKK